MSQERIEAAAKALNNSYGLKWARLPWPELVKSSDNANQNRVRLDREYAANALAAADAVMFSEAMHAKVAQVLWESEGCTWQVQASKVFEALKGDA